MIAGAGTIGLEILDQMPNVDAVVVPIGGGGLIAGISMAIKTHRPDVMIIGVEPENAPSMTAAFREGNPVEVDVECTVADGLSVPKVGQTVRVTRGFPSRVLYVLPDTQRMAHSMGDADQTFLALLIISISPSPAESFSPSLCRATTWPESTWTRW